MKKITILQAIKKLIEDIEKLRTEKMVREICEEEGLNESQCDLIVSVIYCESGMNTKAVNWNRDGTRDLGICQLNTKWYINIMKLATEEEALNNPKKCVRIMIDRYRKGFLKDWVCYNTGKYRVYL